MPLTSSVFQIWFFFSKNFSGQEDANDIKAHIATQCKSLGDRLAHALEVFASSLNYTQTQRSLDDLTYQINQMKTNLTNMPKDLAQALVGKYFRKSVNFFYPNW